MFRLLVLNFKTTTDKKKVLYVKLYYMADFFLPRGFLGQSVMDKMLE